MNQLFSKLAATTNDFSVAFCHFIMSFNIASTSVQKLVLLSVQLGIIVIKGSETKACRYDILVDI